MSNETIERIRKAAVDKYDNTIYDKFARDVCRVVVSICDRALVEKEAEKPEPILDSYQQELKDAADSQEKQTHINIIFDGPPSHNAGRFVEVENDERKSLHIGEWKRRDDGYWALRIPLRIPVPAQEERGDWVVLRDNKTYEIWSDISFDRVASAYYRNNGKIIPYKPVVK